MCSFLSEPINERGNWWENESLAISNLLRVGVKNFCCPSKIVTKKRWGLRFPQTLETLFVNVGYEGFLKANYETNKRSQMWLLFLYKLVIKSFIDTCFIKF